jgi:hypothetical protein
VIQVGQNQNQLRTHPINHLYPYNDAKQTESGHLFEMDDTPTRERIRLQHGKSLTFIEMQPNGDQVHKVFGDDYEITIKNKLCFNSRSL